MAGKGEDSISLEETLLMHGGLRSSGEKGFGLMDIFWIFDREYGVDVNNLSDEDEDGIGADEEGWVTRTFNEFDDNMVYDGYDIKSLGLDNQMRPLRKRREGVPASAETATTHAHTTTQLNGDSYSGIVGEEKEREKEAKEERRKEEPRGSVASMLDLQVSFEKLKKDINDLISKNESEFLVDVGRMRKKYNSKLRASITKELQRTLKHLVPPPSSVQKMMEDLEPKKNI